MWLKACLQVVRLKVSNPSHNPVLVTLLWDAIRRADSITVDGRVWLRKSEMLLYLTV